MTISNKGTFINVALVICLLLVSACASMNSLIVGRIPEKTKCIALLPFVTWGEMTKEEEFLSDFLAFDLVKDGVEGIIHPKEIRKAFLDAKVMLPDEVDRAYASTLGKVVGSDMVLWGDLSYRTISERTGQFVTNRRLISAQAFLVDSQTGDVNWYYDSKKLSTEEDTVKTLAKISTEMKWGLLRDLPDNYSVFSGSCYKPNLYSRLKVFATESKEPQKIALKQKKVVEQKPRDYKLNEDEIALYKKLISGQTVILSGLTFVARKDDLTNQGVVYLSGVGKVLKNMSKDYEFIFTSHMDATNNNALDMSISLDRARVAKAFLIKHYKLDSALLKIRALGGQKPLLPNVNLRSRKKNRRIELKAVKLSK